MKKTILTIAIAAVFAACNSSQPSETVATTPSAMVVQDTNGLAQFKDWKEKQELENSQEIINEQDFATESVKETFEAEKPRVSEAKPRIIYRTAPAKEERIAKVSKPAPRSIENTGGRTSKSRNTNPTSAPVENNPEAGPESGVGAGSEVGNGDVASTTPAEVEKPKNEGWSKAAKGTAIGAGSGAVLGAIISKNKTKGAVIGGVVGAAGGYIFGKKQDKKDGRE